MLSCFICWLCFLFFFLPSFLNLDSDPSVLYAGLCTHIAHFTEYRCPDMADLHLRGMRRKFYPFSFFFCHIGDGGPFA